MEPNTVWSSEVQKLGTPMENERTLSSDDVPRAGRALFTASGEMKKSAFVILTSRTNPEAYLTNRPLDVADFAI